MRLVAALLVTLFAGSAMAEIAPASTGSMALVPAVHHGRPELRKVGAIVTFTSIGVSLVGAALTIEGLPSCIEPKYGGCGGNSAMIWSGIAISALGDGGLVIGGPATWIAGAFDAR